MTSLKSKNLASFSSAEDLKVCACVGRERGRGSFLLRFHASCAQNLEKVLDLVGKISCTTAQIVDLMDQDLKR